MSREQLDVIIRNFQKDPRRMQLLEILGRQLEDLIAENSPDLHGLCDTLKEKKLISDEECRELHAIFAVGAVSTF